MTKLKLLYLITLALTFMLAAIACEGPEGSTGPQGEEGPEGPRGPQGETGTANVIYSDWMDFDWNLVDDTNFKQMYIEESRVVDEDFIANGTLLVFFKVVNSTGLVMAPLPFTSGTDLLYFAIADVPGEGVEGIVIVLSSTNGTAVQSDWTDYQLRYVLIPGGVPAKMGENFLKDYSAVKEYYNLPN